MIRPRGGRKASRPNGQKFARCTKGFGAAMNRRQRFMRKGVGEETR